MAKSTYEEALRRLLQHEGGYTDHPSDPGGPTNFGITIYDYRRYVKPDATASDVKAMRLDEAKAIYRAKYWDSQRCDELPAGVDYAVFDYGVNSGIGRSRKVLQRVLHVKDDGVLGDETMKALAARDPKEIVIAICDERLRFLKRLRTWGVFGKGWRRRVAKVKAFSLALAGHESKTPPVSGNKAAGAITAAGTAAVAAKTLGFPGQTAILAALAVLAVAGIVFAILHNRK